MRALAAALLLALAGCGLFAEARTFELDTITVIDESGLVTSALALPHPSDFSGPTRARRGSSLTELDVAWNSNGCVEHTTLRIVGARAIRVEYSLPPDCEPGTFATYEVRLTLNRAVDAEAVEIEMQAVR